MAYFFKRWFQNNKLPTQNVPGVFLRKLSNNTDLNAHKVNNLEKRFLVWTGKYKSLEEVPTFVSQSVMERTRNRMRIKIANYMMLSTVIGCIVMVYIGKQEAKRGVSVTQQNLDWHAKQKNE